MRVQTVMNAVRLRIIEYLLAHGDGTPGEIGAALSDIPTASLYRHIKVLADDGWIEVVSEQKKRGTVERRYKIASNRIEDASAAPMIEGLMSLAASFTQYFESENADPVRDMLGFSTAALMLDDEEFTQLYSELAELIQKYMGREPNSGRKARRLTLVSSPTEKEER